MDTTRSLPDRVLVVDDDPAFQKLAESVISGCGLDCVIVRSGEEALKLCEKDKPKAIVLDGLLPGVKGDEVARRLRLRYPKDELPILFASAFYRDLKTRTQLLTTVGVDQVLHKPLRAEELKAALLRVPVLAEASMAALTPRPPSAPPLEPLDDDEGSVLLLEEEAEEAELLSEFLALSQERVVGMQAALSSLGDSEAAAERLLVDAHRFRGSGGSYGFPELSRLGGLIEDALAARSGKSGALSSQDRARLVGLVEALAEKVSRAAGKRALLRHEARAQALKILLLDDNAALSQSCVGIDGIRVAHDDERAVSLATQDVPDVAFVASDVSGIDSLSAIRRLANAGVRAVVRMGGAEDMADRLASMKAGASGHVFRLPDASALQRFAAEYHQPLVEARVLAVDSDTATLGSLAESLAPLGLAVEPCLERDEMLACIEQHKPSLVIVSAHAEQPGALDGIRALRADPHTRCVPVLVLSSAKDPAARMAALEAGADDFVSLPYAKGELGARALHHVRRTLRREVEISHDVSTGALREGAFLDVLDRALALARRGGRALAVAVFSTDLREVRLEYGMSVAEALAATLVVNLRTAFRSTDAIARLDERRFAVLLEDVSGIPAPVLVERKMPLLQVRDGARDLTVKMTVGVATFPETSGDGRTLLAKAQPTPAVVAEEAAAHA